MDMVWAILAHGKSVRIVLIDSYSSPKAFTYVWTTSQLCRLIKIPYIPILHGGDFPNRLQKWPRLCKMIFQNSFANVAPSEYLKAAFNKHGYVTTLIPNSIDIHAYPFQVRKKVSPKLLWVRAFDHETYNPKMAIRVLYILSQTYPDAQLCMVGPDKDGSLERCKALATELDVAGQITFTGRLSKKEWIDLSVEFDIFISTTNFDNMPVSVIEAMALGLPVVSTNVGGVPYLIENRIDGYLVPKGDVKSMEEAIQYILSHPDFTQQLSVNARQKAEQFDWEWIQEKWINLLTE